MLGSEAESMTTNRHLINGKLAKGLGLLTLGLLLAVAVSACGSSAASSSSTSSNSAASTTGTTGTTGTTANGSANLSAFRSCLKQQGVTLPQGRPGGGAAAATAGTRPTLSAAQQKAFSACASLRPAGGFGGGGRPSAGATGAAGSSAFASFQTCLKQHGVQTAATGQTSSAKTQSAIAACQKLLPNGGKPGANASAAGGSGAGSTTTTSG
jgi:hypothetical protein